MKVTLDIALLGGSYQAKQQSRGVQRVVSHLFEGLRNSPECDLSFVASSALGGTFDFLTSKGISPGEYLQFTAKGLTESRKLSQLQERIHENLADRRLSARLKRYILSLVARHYMRHEFDCTRGNLRGVDIYHSPHRPFPDGIKSAGHLKRFLTLHDFIPLRNPGYFHPSYQVFMKKVVSCLTPDNFAFCVSNATREDALNFSNIPAENLFVTPLAADDEFFHPVVDATELATVRQRYGLQESPYFLALSANDPHKNFSHLIHCFAELTNAGELPDFNLVIVGSNPNRNETLNLALAEFPEVRSRIILPGFIPDEDLAAVYSGARAFLFPSLAEGFGIPALEAMQCGIPVLASNTTSIPEVVGDAGLLLPPSDVAAWCQAMIEISTNETLHSKLSRRSLSRCKLFSWPRFIEETLRGYHFSLNQR